MQQQPSPSSSSGSLNSAPGATPSAGMTPQEIMKTMRKGNLLLNQAYDLLKKFVGAIDKAWNSEALECPKTRNTYETVIAMGKTTELKEKVIDHFYEEVWREHEFPDGTKKTYAELIRERQLEPLFAVNSKLHFLKQMDMHEKYLETKDDPDFMGPMMDNLEDVISTVETYKKLPKNIHGNIDKVGMDIFQDLVSGRTNLEDLDLEQIGRQALGDNTSSEQIKHLMSNLGDLLQNSMKAMDNQKKAFANVKGAPNMPNLGNLGNLGAGFPNPPK